ncbi:MAG TPA: hypothetical protein VM261_24565 [Kofleriaceae bacterium]|nr:hypothetical protein [Kofleriaceae bacterium]
MAIADELTGGTPSLQLTCSNEGGCHFGIMLDAERDPGGTTDLARFVAGHLRFDLQLLDLDATDVRVRLFDPLDVPIPADALDGSWTAVSLALTPALYGSDGPQPGALTAPAPVFAIWLTPSVQQDTRPMALLNNIRWTVD